MKKIFFLILLSTSFLATANKNSLQNEKMYTDAMASYAALIGFDPLHGKVRGSLQSIQYVDDDVITKTFIISFDDTGCIQSVRWRNIWINEAFGDMKKVGDKLVTFRGKNKEELYLLDSKCKIIEDLKKNDNYIYKNNLISEVRNNGELLKSFEFNEKNELIKIIEYGKPKLAQKFNHISDSNKSPITLIHLYMNTELVAEEKITCHILDNHKNPLRCSSTRRINSETKNIKYIYKTSYW